MNTLEKTSCPLYLVPSQKRDWGCPLGKLRLSYGVGGRSSRGGITVTACKGLSI